MLRVKLANRCFAGHLDGRLLEVRYGPEDEPRVERALRALFGEGKDERESRTEGAQALVVGEDGANAPPES